MDIDAWNYEYSEILVKKLKKLKKRNFAQYSIIMKKIDDVKQKATSNPEHYKNLRYDLSDFKRVHIDKHFVLTFRINKTEKIVSFIDYDHHDNIYG
ncbi:MAG: addiction module toxin RelE [archaeon]|nr:addiction module toxin RelE [archaeon]